jgi:hypothetical protein
LRPPTHLVVYSAPVTKNMSLFNRMQFYAYPPLPRQYNPPVELMADLGLLAGRLYFAFAEYEYLLAHFQDSSVMGKNGIEFLAEWLVMCRKGQDIMHTPIGYICQGRPLAETHPFFVDGSASESPSLPSGAGFGGITAGGGADGDDADEDDDDDDADDYKQWDMQEKTPENDDAESLALEIGRLRAGSESTAVVEDTASGSDNSSTF